jgi:hypothetical protein
MKISEAYLQFVNQVNRNLTNNNVSVDKPRFIILFNDIQNRYVEWLLEKRNEDSIRYVQHLLVPNKKLSKFESSHIYDSFTLPEDYFDLANLHVHASNKSCNNIEMIAREVKSEDVEELYFDDSQQPDLAYRQTFYHNADGKVLVYKKGFDVQDAELSYYKYPKKVDIAGYTKLDGTASEDIDPEFDDKATGRILIAMSKEFSAINDDGQGFQIDSNRLFTSI